MTTTSGTEAPDAQAPVLERPDWASTAAGVAHQMARADFRRGDLAALRRMVPDDPGAVAFWRLMAQHDLLGSPVVERKWALILHGIALMTPTGGGDGASRTAHDPRMAVGRALFLGGESARSTAFYSETRLNRLLMARGTVLRTLLARMFRMLAGAGVSFNWREMAQFILNDGFSERNAEDGRRRIASAYYRTERQSAPPPGDD